MHPVEERIDCIVADQHFGHFTANGVWELHREWTKWSTSLPVRAEFAVQLNGIVV